MSDLNLPKWETAYTAAELEAIRKYWAVPPAECKGKCEVKCVWMMKVCSGCGWDDY